MGRDGYALTLAAFLLLGGALGDRFGRRRIFSIGIAWFAVASAICGFAPEWCAGSSPPASLQGIGGALFTPGSLAIIQASFRPDDRSRAIGAWSGLAASPRAAGPLIGGYLLAVGSWRWVFFINVPVAGLRARCSRPATCPRRVIRRAPAGSTSRAWPWPSCSSAGLTYGLIEGPSHGWSSPAGRRRPGAGRRGRTRLPLRGTPRVRSDAARSRCSAPASSAAPTRSPSPSTARLGGALFLLPVELQIVAHYTPLASGLALLPVTLIMLVFSAPVGRSCRRGSVRACR